MERGRIVKIGSVFSIEPDNPLFTGEKLKFYFDDEKLLAIENCRIVFSNRKTQNRPERVVFERHKDQQDQVRAFGSEKNYDLLFRQVPNRGGQ